MPVDQSPDRERAKVRSLFTFKYAQFSPKQADAIADAFLDKARSASLELRNARAPRVPLLYQCPQLDRLEPWQRGQIVEQARSRVRVLWQFIVSMVISICAVATVAFIAWPFLTKSRPFMHWYVPCLLVCILPQWLTYTFFMRREVRKLALAQCASNEP